jgi:ParB family chromosome partitioning protein
LAAESGNGSLGRIAEATIAEEPGARKPHAGICGGREWVTALSTATVAIPRDFRRGGCEIMEIRDIRLTDIHLSEFNIRKDLGAGTEDAGLEELAESIKEKGLLNPLIVRRRSDGTYELIAGQRRFLACQKLGWQTIPAIIRDVTDDTDATILSLIENVHRADLNPIDKARAYQRIYERYGDHSRVAKETGVSVPTIRKYLTLLELAPSIQERLTTAEGPAGIETLSRVAQVFSAEMQEQVLDRVGGFKQQIQLEMIKRSGGDVGKLEHLREQALEGAFDTHLCRGLDGCPFIPKELLEPVKKAIGEFKEKGETEAFKEMVRKLRW